MVQFEAKFRSIGDKSSPFFKLSLEGNMSDKCLPTGLCCRFHSDALQNKIKQITAYDLNLEQIL